jgi:hypothetical protein
MTNNANSCMGITEDGEVDHTSITGMKSNYPPIINEIAENMISKELLKPFITDREAGLDRVLQYVHNGFKRLNEESPANLTVTKVFDKDLWDHKSNNESVQLYNEILTDCNGNKELAQKEARGGEVYKFYKIKAKNKSSSRYYDRYQLDMKTYRSYLFNAIKPQLTVFGMSEEELSKLKKELVVK